MLANRLNQLLPSRAFYLALILSRKGSVGHFCLLPLVIRESDVFFSKLFYTFTIILPTLLKCHMPLCLPFPSAIVLGSPLSLLLFVLCIEPWAAHIRNNPDIYGIPVCTKEFKLSLFEDDVLLTLTQLHTTLPDLHKEFDLFDSLSGYIMNNSKTKVLSLNVPSQTLHLMVHRFPYTWKTKAVKYLGVNLTSPMRRSIGKISFLSTIASIYYSPSGSPSQSHSSVVLWW